MEEWVVGSMSVVVQLGPFDDADLDLVVKAQNISLGQAPIGMMPAGSSMGGPGISIQEASNAEHVEFWPGVSMTDSNRRELIYKTAKRVLDIAARNTNVNIGFFTMGLEVARVPSWEVAEEIVRALKDHSETNSSIERVVVVAGSPTQVSSFQYALENINIITG